LKNVKNYGKIFEKLLGLSIFYGVRANIIKKENTLKNRFIRKAVIKSGL
jgi:hypothetical protein